MKKELKAQVIESISAQLKETPNFYVTDISGLNAEQTAKLRRACFEAGIKLSVVKNTLFAHVLDASENEVLNSSRSSPRRPDWTSPPSRELMCRSAHSSALTSSRSSQRSSPRKNSSAISSVSSRALCAMFCQLCRAQAAPSQVLSRHSPKKNKNINNLNIKNYYGRH